MVNLGGSAEKCTACTKAVYLTEKIVVEDKEEKKTFHKLCLKCSHCKITLSLGNYASMNGIFYCKPHFKQLFATKGNYDEGFGKTKHTEKWTPSANSAPTSFIKVEETKLSGNDKKETPTGIASKFSGSQDKCAVCQKTVYLTEKTIVEDKEDKKILHKQCLKCNHCSVTLSLGTYASMNGVFYCKPHFKQLFATKGNYDEGFGNSKATEKWTPQVKTGPSSFVPVEKSADVKNSNNSANPDLTKKFATGGQEKCQACQKSVYLTEKVVLEDTDAKKIFHKQCLKCTKCNVVLNLGTLVTLDGTIYCKPHFKELYAIKGTLDESFGKPKVNDKWENNPFPYLEKDANYVPSVEKVESEIQNTATESDINRFRGIESSSSSSRENLRRNEKQEEEEKQQQQEDQQQQEQEPEPEVQQQPEQEEEIKPQQQEEEDQQQQPEPEQEETKPEEQEEEPKSEEQEDN